MDNHDPTSQPLQQYAKHPHPHLKKLHFMNVFTAEPQ